MNHRQLGNSELSVAPLAFGGNVFGWTADEKTSFSLLDHFVEHGFNLIDTADVYSKWVPGHAGGESETIIGKWLSQGGGRRNNIVLATKVGMAMSETDKGLSAARIVAAVDASLRRLKTDFIDLYQAHTDDADTPLLESLGAFDQLIKAGKVRVIGASNYSAPRLLQALEVSKQHQLARYETLQPLYNLVERPAFEDQLAEVCTSNRIGVIPFYSLASGFLSGKYRSQKDLAKSPRGQGVGKYLDARGLRTLDALDEIAAKLGASAACVALAWLMRQPAVTAPIASATSIAQLDELMRAAELEIDDECDDLLRKASANEPAPG